MEKRTQYATRKRNAYILQKFRKKICLLAYSTVVEHTFSFFFYNHVLFDNDSLKDILLALAVGMCFEMSILSIINVPIIIFCALSPKIKPTNSY